MLDTLITSKTRLRLLLKFFLNSRTTSYLRDLEAEFGESTNAIRVELNRLEGAGLLASHRLGNKKIYRANSRHPLFTDIQSILMKHTGIDMLLTRVVNKLGGLEHAYVVGDFARGQDSHTIEVLLAGSGIDEHYLARISKRAEETIGRAVTYTIVDPVNLPLVLNKHPEALTIL